MAAASHSGAASRCSPHPRCHLLPCRAAAKVLLIQLYYSSQLPVVFGLLAPLLAVTSLGLWNMWLALDLLLGALQAGAFLLVLLARLTCMRRSPFT